jgi:hypothetical protein
MLWMFLLCFCFCLCLGNFGDSEGRKLAIADEPILFDAQQLPSGLGGKLDRASGMWIPPHDGVDSTTYDPSRETDSYVRHIWRPNKDGNADDFDLLFPSLCSVNAVHPTATNKLPGFASKRVALVFRGDPLRGMSYGTNVNGFKGTKRSGLSTAPISQWRLARQLPRRS